MPTSTAQAAKLAIVAATGLPKDTLHVYVGLAVFILAALLLRRPVRSFVPWLVVFLVAALGEVVDMNDDLATFGHWRVSASIHDIINTLFWPSVLLLLARFSRVLDNKPTNT